MASISKDSKGYRVRFVDVAGDQRTLRPGKGTTKVAAEQVGRHVDSLVASQMAGGPIDRQTADWLGRIGATLRTKLERAGLVEPLEPVEPEPVAETVLFELGQFLAEYRDDGRTATGERAASLTVEKWRAPMSKLIEFFGHEHDVATITHENAHKYRKWMEERRIRKTKANRKGQPLAVNTIRKHMDNAKVFFNGAKRRGLIAFNPFEHQVSSTKPNRERDYFLTQEDTQKIIEQCSDAEWRLLVALWRLAGLRKMEVFQLTWGDVLFDQGKMRVHATKTAHHEGKDIRFVPLRDIRSELEDLFQQVADKNGRIAPETRIITRFSASNSNLDKPFKAILQRAGLVPWPKLFQNMRASCETEWLNEGHPAHVVAAWIGHSVKVQRDSYAQITDGHYAKFNSHPTRNSHSPESGLPGGLEDVRNDESGSEFSRPPSRPLLAKHEKTPKTLGFSGFQVAVEGFEPSNENTGFGGTGNAGGLPGGLRTDKDCRVLFCDALHAAGFTPGQLLKISDALQQCGLEIVATEPDIG